MKPAPRPKQAINRQRTGPVATTGLVLSSPPPRRPRSRPTTRGGRLPNGIPQQESGRMRNKQRTGAEQVLDRPSRRQDTPPNRRGGFSTKLHLAFDGQGRPLGIHVSLGQPHESTQREPTLD